MAASSNSCPPPLRSSMDNLPVNLITEEILTRLPIRDAVRTSVLSSEWRHRWRSISKLHFKNNFHSIIGLGVTIDRVLLGHSAPIQSFSVESNNITISDTHRWLLHLSLSHHQSLSSFQLSFRCANPQLEPPLHSSLFSFRSLQSLSLYSCSIPNSTSFFFPLLTDLELNIVRVPNEQCIHNLVSRAPNLTKLALISVTPSLLNLTLANAKLRHFIFWGRNCNSIIFAANQTLESVCIYLYKDQGKLDLTQSFPARAVCNGTFQLDGGTVKTLVKRSVPKSLPTCFLNLTVLETKVDFARTEEIMILLCLMRSAPKLQKLVIQGDNLHNRVDDGRDEHIRLDTNFWKKHCVGQLDSLQTVELLLFSFLQAEIDFMIYVLERARLLQKLIIIDFYDSYSYSNDILEMLKNCRRASSKAKIIYKE